MNNLKIAFKQFEEHEKRAEAIQKKLRQVIQNRKQQKILSRRESNALSEEFYQLLEQEKKIALADQIKPEIGTNQTLKEHGTTLVSDAAKPAPKPPLKLTFMDKIVQRIHEGHSKTHVKKKEQFTNLIINKIRSFNIGKDHEN